MYGGYENDSPSLALGLVEDVPERDLEGVEVVQPGALLVRVA